MKAIWYDKKGAPHDVLVLGEQAEPVAGPGEVAVKVIVSGLNPSDTKGRGGWRGVTAMPFARIIPHQDGAGVITGVGAGVDARRIGERVWLYEAQKGRPFGTCAEYVTLPAEQAVPLPVGIDMATGAALGVPAMTAHHALFKDGALHGKTVLVTGGGGAVGQAGIMLAKWAGARVFATVSTPLATEVAASSGADLVIDRKREDVIARVKDATGGSGVDRILEVAFEANAVTNLSLLKQNGVIASYSAGTPTESVAFPFPRYMGMGITLHTIMVYGMGREAHWAAVRDITSALAAGVYKPRIGARFPLDRTADAHVAQDDASVTGKIVVDIAADA